MAVRFAAQWAVVEDVVTAGQSGDEFSNFGPEESLIGRKWPMIDQLQYVFVRWLCG
jgi:hypothetical protein